MGTGLSQPSAISMVLLPGTGQGSRLRIPPAHQDPAPSGNAVMPAIPSIQFLNGPPASSTPKGFPNGARYNPSHPKPSCGSTSNEGSGWRIPQWHSRKMGLGSKCDVTIVKSLGSRVSNPRMRNCRSGSGQEPTPEACRRPHR